VGVGGKKLRLGSAAFACGLIAVAAAGPAAAERTSPRPQPSPRAHPLIGPQAAPGAAAPQSATTGTTTGGGATSSSPPVTSASSPDVVVVTQFRTRTVTKPPATHRPKADPPPKVSSRPIRKLASWFTHRDLVATSAHSLAVPASSSESLLLLLVGLGLVVLVLGETTLLRRAARPTARQRVAEEQLPIRRVQLRR
jgi:hypothetical protein